MSVRRTAAADALFQDTSHRPPKNTKTTMYLPPEVMAAMDRFRLEMRERYGLIVDRSPLIAAMWAYVHDLPDFEEWLRVTGGRERV